MALRGSWTWHRSNFINASKGSADIEKANWCLLLLESYLVDGHDDPSLWRIIYFKTEGPYYWLPLIQSPQICTCKRPYQTKEFLAKPLCPIITEHIQEGKFIKLQVTDWLKGTREETWVIHYQFTSNFLVRLRFYEGGVCFEHNKPMVRWLVCNAQLQRPQLPLKCIMYRSGNNYCSSTDI